MSSPNEPKIASDLSETHYAKVDKVENFKIDKTYYAVLKPEYRGPIVKGPIFGNGVEYDITPSNIEPDDKVLNLGKYTGAPTDEDFRPISNLPEFSNDENYIKYIRNHIIGNFFCSEGNKYKISIDTANQEIEYLNKYLESLDEAKLDEAKLDEAKLDEAKLDDAKLDDAKLYDVIGLLKRKYSYNIVNPTKPDVIKFITELINKYREEIVQSQQYEDNFKVHKEVYAKLCDTIDKGKSFDVYDFYYRRTTLGRAVASIGNFVNKLRQPSKGGRTKKRRYHKRKASMRTRTIRRGSKK